MRCLLNIWGVMLFLRLSWVVGQAGIGKLHFSNNSILYISKSFWIKTPFFTIHYRDEHLFFLVHLHFTRKISLCTDLFYKVNIWILFEFHGNYICYMEKTTLVSYQYI